MLQELLKYIFLTTLLHKQKNPAQEIVTIGLWICYYVFQTRHGLIKNSVKIIWKHN